MMGGSERVIGRAAALRLGALGVAAVVAADLFNGVACYKHGPIEQLWSLCFVAIGFLPGLTALPSANPVKTLGAALFFVPWLVLAYYTDCVMPYQGGGASMMYVAVVIYGFASAALGAFLTGFAMRLLKMRVSPKG